MAGRLDTQAVCFLLDTLCSELDQCPLLLLCFYYITAIFHQISIPPMMEIFSVQLDPEADSLFSSFFTHACYSSQSWYLIHDEYL